MSDSAGIASAWSSARADARQQTMEMVSLKQQAKAEQAVVAMIEAAAQPVREAPPPEGQGRHVDVRA